MSVLNNEEVRPTQSIPAKVRTHLNTDTYSVSHVLCTPVCTYSNLPGYFWLLYSWGCGIIDFRVSAVH